MPERASAREITGLRRDAAIIGIALVVATVPAVMPVMVAALAAQFHINAARAGIVVSANMGGILAGSLLGSALLARFSKASLLAVGLLVMIAGNLVTMWITAYSAALAVRAISGLGEGVAAAIGYALMAASQQPDRTIGFYSAGQSLIGALGMGSLTFLTARHGAATFYLAVSIAALPALVLIPLATRGQRSVAADAPMSVSAPAPWSAWCALSAIFIFFAGMTMIWAFLESIVSTRGFNTARVAFALSASSLAGFMGPLFAGLFGHHLRTGSAILFGALLVILCAGGLAAADDRLFGAAVCLLSFAWGFEFPFLFRCVASTDIDGRVAALTPVATASALMVAPAMGGMILQACGIGGLTAAFFITTLAGLGLSAAVHAVSRRSAISMLSIINKPME